MLQHQHFFVSEPVRHLPWLLLALLEPGPEEVTRLLDQIEQYTGRSCEPGAFYRWLAVVERQGWVERVEEKGSRVLYCLTTTGVGALERQRAQRPRSMEVKETLMRFVSWILRLYPPAWRERYEEEMQSLFELHTITPWTIIDLFWNILRTWLNPSYRLSSRSRLKLRISMAGALLGLAVGLFLFAAMGWIQVSDINVSVNLDHLGNAFWGLTSALLTPIGALSELIAFSSLLFVPLKAILLRASRRNRKKVSRMWLLRLLPGTAALFLLFLPQTWIPSFLGVHDWGFIGSLLLMSLDVAGEITVPLLSHGGAWMERNGSRLILSVSGMILAIGAFNAIWTWIAWQLVPQVDITYPWWATALLIQLVVMVVATVLAGLSLILSLGVSRRLRERRAQPF